jgi:hypothetical protein
MDHALLPAAARPPARWRDLVMPREHGSWSLALEPLLFGLIAGPSLAGGGLALAVVAAFFARRPLRIALGDVSPDRRALARGPLGGLIGLATVFFLGAVALGGWAWLVWLLPAATAGAVFLHFDLRAAGREEIAEIAGAGAFALVPAALAALAGWSAPDAGALALVMLGRTVPSVLGVRACLRAAKTGERRAGPAVAGAALALTVGLGLVRAGHAPAAAVAGLAVLAARTMFLLVWPRPVWRARTLGMIETVLGAGFVLTVAWAWRA